MMDKERLLSLAGLCRRAGGVVPGVSAALGATDRACLLVLSTHASDRTKKQVRDKAKSRAVPLLETDADCDTIAHALGLISPCALFAVMRKGPYAPLLREAQSNQTKENEAL